MVFLYSRSPSADSLDREDSVIVEELPDYDDCLKNPPSISGCSSSPPRQKLIVFSPFAIGSKNKKYKAVGVENKLYFKMVKNENKLVKAILTSYGFSQTPVHNTSYNVLWTGSHLKPYGLRALEHFQRVNHFPRSFELTRKDRLYRNIERMKRLRIPQLFNFIPEFYVLPNEFERYKEAHFYGPKGPWIVKPVGSSRGRGIFLVMNPDDVPLCSPVLVSRYISNPFVFTGHKFDIRLYAAVTSFHPLTAYLYSEGLARFASERYNANTHKTMDDVFVHLTNYSINKKSTNFLRSLDPNADNEGHKWSLSALLSDFSRQGIDVQLLMLRVEDLVVKTLISAQSSVASACLSFVPFEGNCFELFGFDILLDTDMKPWLLEVNLSPSLSCDAPIDFKIKSKMVCDLLSLAGVSIHKPPPDISPLTRLRSADRRRVISSKHRPMLRKFSHNIDSVPKLRELSVEDRVANSASRIRGEQERSGAYYRLIPTESSWLLYGDLLETLKPNVDELVHQTLYPGFHEDPVNSEHVNDLRNALCSPDTIQSVFQMKKEWRDLIPDAMKRALLYQQKRHTALKKVSIPRLKKFRQMSQLSLLSDSDARSVDRYEVRNRDKYKEVICGARELSSIFGSRPHTSVADQLDNSNPVNGGLNLRATFHRPLRQQELPPTPRRLPAIGGTGGHKAHTNLVTSTHTAANLGGNSSRMRHGNAPISEEVLLRRKYDDGTNDVDDDDYYLINDRKNQKNPNGDRRLSTASTVDSSGSWQTASVVTSSSSDSSSRPSSSGSVI